MATTKSPPVYNKKFIFIALLCIFLMVFVYMARDKSSDESKTDETQETRSFSEITNDWYISEFGSAQVPTIQKVSESQYYLQLGQQVVSFPGQSFFVEINNKEGDVTIAEQSFETDKRYESINNLIYDDRYLLFDLTLEEDEECTGSCISEFAKIAGIWVFDLQEETFNRIVKFQLK